jgi:hypothetical protein
MTNAENETQKAADETTQLEEDCQLVVMMRVMNEAEARRGANLATVLQ